MTVLACPFLNVPTNFSRVKFGKEFQDEHILHLNYELAVQKEQKWSVLFEKVGKLAESVGAADYSISQTTLDQVIIEYAYVEV